MDTFQLKQELIQHISKIEDRDFLNSIKIFLNYEKRKNIIELSDEQEKELLYASKEGKNGIIISQSEMDQKVEEWFNVK